MAPENDMVGGCNDQQCPDKHALLGANTFIDETDAPTMVCHGSTDNIVPQCEGKMFFDNLQKAGVECVYYPHGGGHGVAAEYTDKMIDFFKGIREKKAAAQVVDPTIVEAVNAVTQSICVSDETLYLCDSEAEPCTFTLSDISGKILMQGQLDAEGVSISELSKGAYIVRTNNGSSIKFIK